MYFCVFTGVSLFVVGKLGIVFLFCVFRLCCCLVVVSDSAIDCPERLVFKMTYQYYVLSGMLNLIYPLTPKITSGLKYHKMHSLICF